MNIELIKSLAPFVPLVQTVIWVLLIICGVFLFRSDGASLIVALRKRIERGASFKAGPIEIGEDLKGLEYVAPGTASNHDEAAPSVQDSWAAEREEIYRKNRGVFLTHVLSPSKDPGQEFDIFIYLIKHKSEDLGDIKHADFFFGHMWGNRVFKEKQKAGRIGVSTSAYGPFLCTCRVTFSDGYETKINRYVDFEMGRLVQQAG
ncbi:MAG: pYEATS domain-containing protein [Acidobacteriota bacterium]